MKLVIKQHRPVRRVVVLTAIAAVALLGVAIAFAFDYGHWQSISHAMVATGEQRTLLDEVGLLKAENATLHRDLRRLRRVAQVNKFARRDDHEQFVRLQSEMAALKREVQFFRDVLGNSEVEQGPQIKGIQIKPLDSQGRFGYRLVLTHFQEDDREVEGMLKIGVRGEIKGQQRALPLADLIESGPENFGFKFKHFRLFEGTLKLPDGFVPRQISVAVQSKMSAHRAAAETYDWASVLN